VDEVVELGLLLQEVLDWRFSRLLLEREVHRRLLLGALPGAVSVT
jgi:hypothetical protein